MSIIETFETRARHQSFGLTLVEEIIFEPLDDNETPTSRLKQFAMMHVLHTLDSLQMPLTLTTLTEMTGLTGGAVLESVNPLVVRGLLLESWGRTSLGRGKAKQYELAPPQGGRATCG